MPIPQPSTSITYVDMIPVIWGVGKLLVAVIGIIGGALVSAVIWAGKKFLRGHESLENKVDTILMTILHCDGCKQAVDNIVMEKTSARRSGDPRIRIESKKPGNSDE